MTAQILYKCCEDCPRWASTNGHFSDTRVIRPFGGPGE